MLVEKKKPCVCEWCGVSVVERQYETHSVEGLQPYIWFRFWGFHKGVTPLSLRSVSDILSHHLRLNPCFENVACGYGAKTRKTINNKLQTFINKCLQCQTLQARKSSGNSHNKNPSKHKWNTTNGDGSHTPWGNYPPALGTHWGGESRSTQEHLEKLCGGKRRSKSQFSPKKWTIIQSGCLPAN